jgi:hypothetical protein
MSFEVTDAKVEDLGAAVWRLKQVTFTGAAVLRRDKAAYGQTEISIVNETNAKEKGMNEQQVQAMEKIVAAADSLHAVLEKIQTLQEKVEQIAASVETREASVQRKTIPASVSVLLEKGGIDAGNISTEKLDQALAGLSVEQRIAVKSQLARAGAIG